MKTTTNKLMISSLLAITVGLSVANGEMIKVEGGVTLDTNTKLIWQDNHETKTVKKDGQGAIVYCENLQLGGIDGWKLPDFDTLKALYSKKDGLQNVTADDYWSSSPVVSDSGRAWGVHFVNGNGYRGYESISDLVRCVKDSNFDTLTLPSFIESLKTSNSTQNSIVLSSSLVSESQFFLIKKDNKNYFGTKSELLKQFEIREEIKVGYSKTPFA